MFRATYDCSNQNMDYGYVRADDLELNPGLVQIGWEEKLADGNWNRDIRIDVDCVGK